MAKRRRKIPLEQRPIGECTIPEIVQHIQDRDQIIFIIAIHEVSEGKRLAYIDKCAYSGHLFELTRDLLEKIKEHRDEEGKGLPGINEDLDDD